MRIRQIFPVLLAAVAFLATAVDSSAKDKEVEGSYRYYILRNVARDRAEQTALERAMVAAMAKEFGTVVQQDTRMDIRSSHDGYGEDFWSSASSLVKGEWVQTIGVPHFEVEIEDGDFVISCKVKGLAREIQGVRADLIARILRNGTADSDESSTFVSGDKCFLSFTTPVDGYMAVYLEGADGMVYRMLPFYAERHPAQPVKAGQRYLFFASTEGDAEQYQMTTDKDFERNTIYIVFSPNTFVKPIDRTPEEELALRELSSDDFRKWVTKARMIDHDLQLLVRPITITAPVE